MKKTVTFFVVILFAFSSLTSCSDKKENKETKENPKDSLAYLYGDWKFEEMGVIMKLKINSDKSFYWDSDYGGFVGTWTCTNDIIDFKPNDDLNPPFKLIKTSDGRLEEETTEEIKPIYVKQNVN